jgi:hypothetical protein
LAFHATVDRASKTRAIALHTETRYSSMSQQPAVFVLPALKFFEKFLTHMFIGGQVVHTFLIWLFYFSNRRISAVHRPFIIIPDIKGCFADPHLMADFGHRVTGLSLLQSKNNLRIGAF